MPRQPVLLLPERVHPGVGREGRRRLVFRQRLRLRVHRLLSDVQRVPAVAPRPVALRRVQVRLARRPASLDLTSATRCTARSCGDASSACCGMGLARASGAWLPDGVTPRTARRPGPRPWASAARTAAAARHRRRRRRRRRDARDAAPCGASRGDTTRSSHCVMKFQGSVKSEPHEKPAVATPSSVEESSSAAATVVSSLTPVAVASPDGSPGPSSSPSSAVARVVSAASQGRAGAAAASRGRTGAVVSSALTAVRDSLAVAGPRRGGSEGPSGLLGAA